MTNSQPTDSCVLFLSREGIFPLYDGGTAATGLRKSGTIQGEGKLCGIPSLFVRLQGCNLRCAWHTADGQQTICDTPHSWREGKGTRQTVADVASTIAQHIGDMRHVVITGGEPYMQRPALLWLLNKMAEMGLHTTVETNGTLPYTELAKQTSLTSISPKLKSSGISQTLIEKSRQATLALTKASLENGREVQIKFVVSETEEADEIMRDYSETISMLKPEDIIVMPLGASVEMLRQTSRAALAMAVENGWRYGPRLHIDLFGNKEGT